MIRPTLRPPLLAAALAPPAAQATPAAAAPQNGARRQEPLLRSEGRPQLYGTRFDSVDGKSVLAPTRDIKGLDARRPKVGLPPLAEYIKGLRESYKVPVIAEGVALPQ